MNIILLLTTSAFGATAVFLLSEFRKKFGFMREFVQTSEHLVITYAFPGAKATGHKVGMRNMALQSLEPFQVLVGFRLLVPIINYEGFDYFGFVSSKRDSDGRHSVVISTYIGNGDVDFQFLLNVPKSQVHFSIGREAQTKVPDAVYPPHWWQRLGFYA